MQPHRNRKYFQFNNAHDCTLSSLFTGLTADSSVCSCCIKGCWVMFHGSFISCVAENCRARNWFPFSEDLVHVLSILWKGIYINEIWYSLCYGSCVSSMKHAVSVLAIFSVILERIGNLCPVPSHFRTRLFAISHTWKWQWPYYSFDSIESLQ